jgi:hypothetical protein
VIVERLASGGPLFVIEQPGGHELALTALGRARAWLRIDGVVHELSRRHSELAVMLAGTPGGMTGEELARAVHGPGGKPATVRGERARMRRVLG